MAKPPPAAYGTSDYTKARIYHFLHDTNPTVESGILASTKAPFESRVWYQYKGQTDVNFVGATALVSRLSRVLDDGATQAVNYDYNAQGQMIQMVDPYGRETDFLYAVNGVDMTGVSQKTSSGIAAYYGLATGLVSTATSDVLWTIAYNAAHQPLTVTDAAGQTTTATYNADGDLQTVTTPPTPASPMVGETTTLAYYPNHSHRVQTVTGAVAGAVSSLTYDSFGRVATVTDSEGYTVAYGYDAFDRPTRVTYPDGTSRSWTYNRLDLATATDRLGRVTTYTYNALRRLAAVTDPLGRMTQYEWCYCGALQRQIDPAGNITKWSYDIEGRKLSKTYADDSQTLYGYEANTARIKTVQDALGQVAHYAYGIDNTLASVTYSGAVHATPGVSYAYDAFYRRPVTMTDGTGTAVYTYGLIGALGANQLASETIPQTSSTVAYSYDALGRFVGTSVDGIGQTVSYDVLDRFSQAVNPLGTFQYAYLRNTTQVSGMIYPSGQAAQYTYLSGAADPLLQRIRNLGADGTSVLSQFDYAYDPEGEITRWTQQQNDADAGDHGYVFNAAGWVANDTLGAAVSGLPTVTNFVYDSGANRVSEQRDGQVTQGTFNNLNQLTTRGGGGYVPMQGTVSKFSNVTVNGNYAAVDTNSAPESYSYNLPVTVGTNTVTVAAQDGSGNASTNRYQFVVGAGSNGAYTYDLNGNLTGDGLRAYQWDAANRLLQIAQGGNTYQFAYDGQGRRVSETDNGTLVKQWVWIGATLAEERDGGNTVTKRFYDQGEQIGAVAYTYTYDHLGSVRELTDAGGAVHARYNYDVYGRVVQSSGDVASDFQYAGMLAHQATGLNLTLFRAYDAETGRWLSRDPIAEAGGINLYAYTQNGPINQIDPWGLAGYRLDLYDHGGPHIQNGSQRWDAKTLQPITHMGQTPDPLTPGKIEDLRQQGLLDKIAKNVPDSAIEKTLDSMGVGNAQSLPSKCSISRQIISRVGVLSAVGAALAAVQLSDAARTDYEQLQTTGSLSDYDKQVLVSAVATSGLPGAGAAAGNLLNVLQ